MDDEEECEKKPRRFASMTKLQVEALPPNNPIKPLGPPLTLPSTESLEKSLEVHIRSKCTWANGKQQESRTASARMQWVSPCSLLPVSDPCSLLHPSCLMSDPRLPPTSQTRILQAVSLQGDEKLLERAMKFDVQITTTHTYWMLDGVRAYNKWAALLLALDKPLVCSTALEDDDPVKRKEKMSQPREDPKFMYVALSHMYEEGKAMYNCMAPC